MLRVGLDNWSIPCLGVVGIRLPFVVVQLVIYRRSWRLWVWNTRRIFRVKHLVLFPSSPVPPLTHLELELNNCGDLLNWPSTDDCLAFVEEIRCVVIHSETTPSIYILYDDVPRLRRTKSGKTQLGSMSGFCQRRSYTIYIIYIYGA